MTEQQQTEWQQIRAQQDVLRQEWARLETRLASFAASLERPPVEGSPAVSAVPPPMQIPRTSEVPPPAPAAKTARTAAAAEVPAQSLEMRIGTTWLVRAGIVLLLTSLAFLGNYLYQNVVPHLGPGGKVALLYLGAGVLTGFGAWLERSRQARELTGLRDYARVVLAGGLAAIYYVTYAAHYYPQLRVIESALAAGLLLLGWAAFLVWLADRRESEILATFAVLLAYYTSAINEIAGFTLVSNLVLTAGAVYLLRRHLWRVFPFASLLATFGSYGFWHLCYTHPVWRVLSGSFEALPHGGGFWLEGGFLLVYWALFTWAVFTTGERILPAARRATFISLNNAAFFVLTTWILLADYADAFWKWSLVFGAALAFLGELGRRKQPPLEVACQHAYELQGSLLITLGCVDYFSGWQLSLALAVQSRVLLQIAGRRRSGLFLVFAASTATLAFCVAASGLDEAKRTLTATKGADWVTAFIVGAFFIEEAWCCERWRLRTGVAPPMRPLVEEWQVALLAASAVFAVLGAGIWLWLLEAKITFAPVLAPSLALAAVAMLLLGRALRVAALLFFAQAYLIAAQVHWMYSYGGVADWVKMAPPPWWNVAGLLGATLAFGEICRLDKGAMRKVETHAFWQGLQVVAMALGTLCGWCYVSQHLALLHGSAFNIAARWSLYAAAVFAVGLALRERVYRWLGLLILVATLGRVAFFDIWQIDLLERALSLLTLGIVLLGMGFFYTRFGSKVRDLL